MEPLADDLRLWLRRHDKNHVFPSPRTRDEWTVGGFSSWAVHTFKPAAGTVPYHLRHSFVSLLILGGHPILYVARQAGHAPAVSLGTYGHIFDAYEGSTAIDPVAAIYEARSA